MTRRIRVLVVDDSAFARKVIRDSLSATADIDVVGIARDGLEALEKIAELSPDVMTLDLVMPNLDGIGVLKAMLPEGAPRVIVVSISDKQSELAVEALLLGAIDVVHKPTALASDQLYELGGELVAKVRAAAEARPLRLAPAPARHRPSPVASLQGPALVVLGTSTGGPQALTRLLMALPGSFPVPIAIALHIPAGYTDSLSRRLDDSCELTVREASPGLVLAPGTATIARGGLHLKIARDADGTLRAVLDTRPTDTAHFPCVDVLFESAVEACGGRLLGVVLTGMGDDGTRGSGAIHRAGGRTIVEAASSCVVYGMPRSVVEAGFAAREVSLDDMAAAMVREV